MRVVSVVLVILGCVGRIAAQCDSSIGPADTVASVKKKLACFAAENEKLKQALSNAETRLKGQLRIYWTHRTYGKLTSPKCLSNFTHALTNRGGAFIEKGQGWIDYQLGEDAISITCNASDGYIILSGRDISRLDQLRSKIEAEVFSAVR